MPPLAAARSPTIALVMPPAAPVTTKTRVLVEHHARLAVGGRSLFQRYAVAQPIVIANFHHAGVGQRFGDQRLGRLGRLAAWLEIDRLDQHVRRRSRL